LNKGTANTSNIHMKRLLTWVVQALTTLWKEHEVAICHLTEDSEPSSASTDASDSSESAWEVSSDSEVEKLPEKKLPRRSSDKEPGRPGSSALLDSINFIVECLWRLPIRRPAPADRIKDKTAADTTGYFPFDLMYVRDKFPGLNEKVAARLAKMISRRRQLIRYRKDHTDALQNVETTVTDKSEHNNPSSPRKVHMASEAAPSLKAPSQRTEQTKATTLKINAPIAPIWRTAGLYVQSVSESGSSAASEQAADAITVRFPNRPRSEEGQVLKKYICPYCSIPQVAESERRWE
jgi:hypothetical protein